MPSGDQRRPSHASSAGFGRRILALADQLATHSEAPDRLCCTYLTPAHRAVARQLQSLMQSAGLDVALDTLGNVVGRLGSARPQARTLIIGSHYDTVRNAGRYDGRLGILTGLVVLEAIVRNRVALPFDVELIAFAEEEGVRFGTSYLGSSAVADRFDPAALARRDASGVTVADAIRAAGGDPAGIPGLARNRRTLLGYLEVHIEQGPVLLNAGLPLGIVSAISGSVRYRVAIAGEAGHAGTVPMATRRDAAAAAAELVLYLEQRCRQSPGLVGTVGELAVPDGAVNVIPSRCDLTLDIRADDDAKLEAAIADVRTRIRELEARRGVAVVLSETLRAPVVPCSARMRQLLAESLGRAGIDATALPSGAGHDAVMFHGVTEIGMLFVRCGNGGVSHSPLETITEADADLAATVLLDALNHLHDQP